MEINFKINDKEEIISLNQLCILFGENNSGKSKILYQLKDDIEKASPNILINGNKINKNDYNVLYFDEETDFNNEFKFTKNNVFRSIIYDDIICKVNEEKILNEINETFNIIDDKVNKYINNKLLKMNVDNLVFDTNIPDINKIIEKFTDIYFNDYLLSDNNVSKSVKRMLIYQLLLIYINSNLDKELFIIIDNFDVYLDNGNTLKILNLLNKYANKFKNVKFIISTSKNIYKYINKTFSVYKVINYQPLKFDFINKLLNEYLLKKEYINKNIEIDFDEYVDENSHLIHENDIIDAYNNIYVPNLDKIGDILVNENIILIENLSTKTSGPYIYCNNDEKILFELILKYIDKLKYK